MRAMASRSKGTFPRGVANASTLGAAMPRNGTRWEGPATTTRVMVARAGVSRA